MTMKHTLRYGSRTLVLAATALGLITTAVPAAAGEQPTAEQIMADCASGEGKCSFNAPQLGKAYLGEWGHYYWFVPDTVTGPAPNGTDGKHSAVVVKSRSMTADEKTLCAGGSTRNKVFTRSS
ncbi:hypothetical protein [Streptomyces tibetensis]|uniref:hypothetical protein n=1 Tax=Streptomyces tibetensis TaxID=2382123 RepID=UPI0033C95E4D